MRRAWMGGLAAVTAGLTGCGEGEKVKPHDVEIKIKQTPLDQAISFLNQYAQGNPLGSEAAMFDDVIKGVRDTDAGKADLLQKGFEDIKKASPAQRKSLAASLIKRVSPNTAPPPP